MRARTARGSDTGERLAGVRFLRTFDGSVPSAGILAAIRDRQTSGVVLFRARNVESPGQVRELSRQLQAARPEGDPPLVIGLDQEGGQLQAVGTGATGWPGNLALGATRSPELAVRAGRALGAEAVAMGATLVFAPVCDLLYPASATPLGTRPFGSEPELVGPMTAAMVAGIQASGAAAALKHFPGHGAAVGDSHVATPVVRRTHAELRARDLRPFEAGIAAGAAAVLVGHLAVPALTDGSAIPATVSPRILEGLLRAELGFRGVSVSDAMDMGGAGGAARLFETLIAATDAGMDLLLMAHPEAVEADAFSALASAISDGRLDAHRLRQAEGRILAARNAMRRAVDAQPSLAVVGSDEHRALADEIARASITLVRDPRQRLPLTLGTDRRVLLIAPVPVDLTPAETSSFVPLELAAALRARGVAVTELVASLDPGPADVAGVLAAASDHDVVLMATFDAVAFAGQRALVAALAGAAGARTLVAMALRTPYDVAVYPNSVAAVCTYGIQPAQMTALADALLGAGPFAGTLPVELPASARIPADWTTTP